MIYLFNTFIQAKKDGLKRISVQTDFKLTDSDYLKTVEKRFTIDILFIGSLQILNLQYDRFMKRSGERSPNAVMYDKILEYMNEMEVRSTFPVYLTKL